MATTSMIPIIWHDAILESYDTNFMYKNLANSEYEGEIKEAGNTVRINTVSPFSAENYTGTISTYQAVTSVHQDLLINQEKVVPVISKRLEEIQSKPKYFSAVTKNMGEAVSEDIEKYIASLHTTASNKIGSTGTPKDVNSANVLTLIAEASVALSDNKVPKTNRVCVAPPWFMAKVGLSKLIKDTNNSDIIRNAYVGDYFGFSFYESIFTADASASGEEWSAPMFFRAMDSIAAVVQLNELDNLKDKDTMENYIRAYFIYGAKIIRPTGVVTLYAKEVAEA